MHEETTTDATETGDTHTQEWYAAQIDALTDRFIAATTTAECDAVEAEMAALKAQWFKEHPDGAFSVEEPAEATPEEDITLAFVPLVPLRDFTLIEFTVLGGDYPVQLRHGNLWGGTAPTTEDADGASMPTLVNLTLVCPHCSDFHRPRFAWDGTDIRILDRGGVAMGALARGQGGVAQQIIMELFGT